MYFHCRHKETAEEAHGHCSQQEIELFVTALGLFFYFQNFSCLRKAKQVRPENLDISKLNISIVKQVVLKFQIWLTFDG